MNSVPHSSALKKILSFDYVIILKPECVEVNQLESLVQKVQGFILPLIMFMFSRTAKHKRHFKYQLSFMMNLYILLFNKFNKLKCKKQNHKYYIARAKLFLLQILS